MEYRQLSTLYLIHVYLDHGVKYNLRRRWNQTFSFLLYFMIKYQFWHKLQHTNRQETKQNKNNVQIIFFGISEVVTSL